MIIILWLLCAAGGFLAALLGALGWQCAAILFHLPMLTLDQIQAIGGLAGVACMFGSAILSGVAFLSDL